MKDYKNIGLFILGVVFATALPLAVNVVENQNQSYYSKVDPISPIVLPPDFDRCKSCSFITKWVAWSLDYEPNSWEVARYSSSNTGEISAYLINIPGRVEARISSSDHSPDQQLLLRAYKRWLSLKASGRISK